MGYKAVSEAGKRDVATQLRQLRREIQEWRKKERRKHSDNHVEIMTRLTRLEEKIGHCLKSLHERKS